MNFDLDERLRAIRDQAKRRFDGLRDQSVDFWEREDDGELPQELWSALSDAGFFRALLKKENGGDGNGLWAAALILEEFAAAGFTPYLPVLTALGGAVLQNGGSTELKTELLPKVANGQCRIGLAMTESTGYNIFAIETVAEIEADHYVVEGTKEFVSGADLCDYVVTVVRTLPLHEVLENGLPKHHGISLLLVDPADERIESNARITRGDGVYPWIMKFNEVEVPKSHRIGEEHQGILPMLLAFNVERVLASAIALGASRFCLEVACNYAKRRRVFGNYNIGAYQAIQHPLADARIRQEAVRGLVYRAAQAFDDEREPLEIAQIANMAKYLGTELGLKAVDAAIQTLGGRGFDEEHGIIQLWEKMRLYKVAPISNELLLNGIAEQLLDLPRSY